MLRLIAKLCNKSIAITFHRQSASSEEHSISIFAPNFVGQQEYNISPDHFEIIRKQCDSAKKSLTATPPTIRSYPALSSFRFGWLGLLFVRVHSPLLFAQVSESEFALSLHHDTRSSDFRFRRNFETQAVIVRINFHSESRIDVITLSTYILNIITSTVNSLN